MGEKSNEILPPSSLKHPYSLFPTLPHREETLHRTRSMPPLGPCQRSACCLQRAWHPHEARTLCPRGSAASCALRGSHRRPSRASPPWWDPGGAAAAASCRGERSNGAWAVSSRSPGGSKASGSGGRPQLRHRGARRGQEAGHAHTERPLPRLGPGRDPLGDSGLERLEHVCAVPAGWLGRDQSEEGEERVHGHRRGARRKARP